MKSSRLCALALAVLTSAFLVTDARATNLLANASFESVLEYGDPNLPNWFAFFGAGSTGTFSTIDGGYGGSIDPSDGVHHLSIANDGTASGFSGVLQRVPASPSVDYTFSFEAKSNSGPVFPLGAEYRIEWLDGADVFISSTPTVAIAGLLTDSYQPFTTGAWTAPAGTAKAVAVVAIETFTASGSAGNLFVDNSSLSAIPEPGTISLLGLGALGLLAGRRRRVS